MSRVFLLPFFFFSGLTFPLYAGELPLSYDPLRGLEFFRKILEEQRLRYILLEGDLFEKGKEGSYFAYAPTNILADIRYISKLPLPKELFDKEKQMIQKYIGPKKGFASSLFIQTAFNNPGEESFVLKRHQPALLQGKVLRASLWVHSQGYPHRLVLLFQRANGRALSVSAGNLFWRGWRRLDLNLNHTKLGTDRRKNRSDYKAKFLGFRIQSAPNSEPGSLSLLFDNFLLLSEQQGKDYPGSEIEDSWDK